MIEYDPGKTGEYLSDILQVSKLRVLRKILEGNKHRSLHLALKYAQISALGYLFLKAHSFPRATLSEDFSLLGTENVRLQISELSKFSAPTIAFLAF